jgi:DNA-binding NarL/FixJ family response regulator
MAIPTALTQNIIKLKQLRLQLSGLEAQVQQALPKELASLHLRYGFSEQSDFIKAVRAAVRKPGTRKVAQPAKNAPRKARKARKQRVTITDEIRARVAALVAQAQTNQQIAKQLNLSIPTVIKIKKAPKSSA